MSASVFIVDDDPTTHMVLRKAMRRHSDWSIYGADSYAQALETVGRQPFDLLVIDRNLEDGRGSDLVRKVRRKDPFVGIVMMTAQISIENAIEMLHLDVDRYIEKPFNEIGLLLSDLEEIVEKTRQRREMAASGVVLSRSIPAPRVSQPSTARTVLIVSPVASDRMWIEHQLRGRSIVRHANSSSEAKATMEQFPPDILIVDKGVRDPDIFAFIEYVNKSIIGVNVVVISDGLSLSEVQRFIALDVAALLEEPWETSKFRERVARLVGVDFWA